MHAVSCNSRSCRSTLFSKERDLPLDAQKEGMTVRLLQHVPCVCVLLLCHSIQVDNVQVMFARLFIDFHNTFEDGIF